MSAKTKYYCADCGKKLSETEKPCSKCGSTRRRTSVEIQDIIKLRDDVSSFVDSFESLSKSITWLYVVTIGVLAFCFLLAMIDLPLKHERVIFASTGVLTFIAIFYSLLVSKEGRETMDLVENRTGDKKKQLDLQKEKLEKLKNEKSLSELKKELKKLSVQLMKVDFVKQMLDIEYILLFAVVALMFSIIFALFNQSYLIVIAYILFSIGIGLSFVIVVEWRIISKFSKTIEKQK